MKLFSLFFVTFLICAEVSADCNLGACISQCLEMQYENGQCFGDLCICYKQGEFDCVCDLFRLFYIDFFLILDVSNNRFDMFDENVKASCSNDECSQFCWNIGNPGGICSFGVCRCYKWDRKNISNIKK